MSHFMRESVSAGIATTESDIAEIYSLYTEHVGASHHIRYPKNKAWLYDAIEKNKFFLYGAWCHNTLVGAGWISFRDNRVYFQHENNLLLLKTEGRAHGEVGGMLVHPQYRKLGVNSALCLAWWTCAAWFPKTLSPDFSFTTRVAGVSGSKGPRFWELCVARHTGLSYEQLEHIPFDEHDVIIADMWQGNRIIECTEDILILLGKPYNRIMGEFQKNFSAWGLVWRPNEYSPNGLTKYHEARLGATKVPPLTVSRTRVLLSPEYTT